MTRHFATLACAAVLVLSLCPDSAHGIDAAIQSAIESDWMAQEKRLGRTADSPQAIQAALTRAERLANDLRTLPNAPDLSADASALQALRNQAAALPSLDQAARLALYKNIRALARELALKNPLFSSKPIVFMKRRRFVCQMLHEYLGYYHGDLEGGGVYLLEKPGQSFAIKDLLANRLPPGSYTTLALSYDARTIYFAFTEKAAPKPDFYNPQPNGRYFHIYAMNADGTNLRPLTQGQYDDFDPCPLPDGGIAFMSTRRTAGFIRCSNPWEPIPAYTLHRMAPDGSNLRTLSFHETNEWHPSVLNDGRIVYIRWDYVDRSAANFHGLWTSNPDGSNPASLFGNYTARINAFYQPRAVPGSQRILFVAGAHHADVGGSLVLLDPSRAQLDPASGEDRFDGLETLTPEVCFPEAPGWPSSYFHSPWPLSENYYLVSFSFDRLPGMSSGGKTDTTGLYYFDRFGNLELLYRDKNIGCMYPIPLAPRPIPPVIPSTLDERLGEEGEFVVSDVRQSLFAMPADRPIRQLRVFQILPKTNTHIVNDPRIGHASAESTRMLLGTVPVEPDGSAYFRAPARKPLYFQAVDESGKAVQSMRSITYLQPGERRSCVGCHEPRDATPATRTPLALQRPPSAIQPGPDGTHPFSFVRLVQPVLDQHCVRCHDGSTGPDKSPLVLTGQPTKTFTRSYDNLRPFLRWQEWGGQSIGTTVTRPGQNGADASPLTGILDDATHARHLRLPDADRLRLHIWLDANVPFYGTYGNQEQKAQRDGQAVPPPRVH